MSTNSKRRKKILKEFSHLSEQAFLVVLESAVKDYVKLLASESAAAGILAKYEIHPVFSFNEKHKESYRRIIECATLRDVEIPTDWLVVTPSDNEVIERILEIRYEWTKWIDKHSYLLDGNYEGYSSLSSEERMEQIKERFDQIISKEFNSPKKTLL